MKITGQIEEIFAQAVALEQSGGLRNTIYASGREIFILNYDHTLLMRFRLKTNEKAFDAPVCFRANDYDSNEFFMEDGKIVFLSDGGTGFQRKKTCGKAEYEFEDIQKLFNDHLKARSEDLQKVQLNKTILALLEDNLSHIEFSGEAGKPLKMIQRNIYSGGVIEVQEKTGGLFHSKLEKGFGPIGIKTGDFQALFTFADTLNFEFPSGDEEDFILVKNRETKRRDITCIIACCLYDEIIKIKEVKKDGR